MAVSELYVTKGGDPLNDDQNDGDLGELVREFDAGPNGFFNVQSALKGDKQSNKQLSQDEGVGFKSFLQHNNVDNVVKGFRIQAIPETSKLGQALNLDGKEFSTPSYAIMVLDDETRRGDSVFKAGDFATLKNNPFAFDDGGDFTNGAETETGGTAAAIVADVKGGIIGTSRDDQMIGGKGGDYFSGGRGNDLLQGKGGNDTLLGGFGNDNIAGGKQGDRIRGGAGDDLLRGGDRFGKFGPDFSDNFGQFDEFVFEGNNNGHDRITDFGLANGDNPADKLIFRRDNSGKVELSAELNGNGDLKISIENFVGVTGSVTLDGIDTLEEVKEVFGRIGSFSGPATFINPLNDGFADGLFPA